MSLSQLKIGSVAVTPPLILAPMSGVTSSCFRRLIRAENPGAVGLLVTEFISVEGMTRKNEQSLRMMRFREEERPISIQIFGYDIDRMCDAARMVEQSGADIVDINSGCPVPKVVKKGGGCELMRQPDHLAKLLAALRKSVSIPLTLKIRAGWDVNSQNALEIAQIAEQCGVDMLAVHGRTRTQMYRGEADWGVVERVATALRIPVVGSGDVVCSKSASERLQSGVAGLMIGRAAIENPWVFSDIYNQLHGRDVAVRWPEQILALLLRYSEMLEEDVHPKAIMGRLKQITSQVTRKIPRSSGPRKELLLCRELSQFRDRVNEWRDALAELRNGSNECLSSERVAERC